MLFALYLERAGKMFDRLSAALQAFRLASRLSSADYSLARKADVELLAVLERLERRVKRLEDDRRLGL